MKHILYPTRHNSLQKWWRWSLTINNSIFVATTVAIIRQLSFVFGAICSDRFVNRSLLSWVWYIKNKKRINSKISSVPEDIKDFFKYNGFCPSQHLVWILFAVFSVSVSRKKYPLLLLLSKLVRAFLKKHINSELMQSHHCQIHEATGIASVPNK